jgi:C-terminal processing protease CtpA/Prc
MMRFLIAFALGLALFTAGCEEQNGTTTTTAQQPAAQQPAAAPTQAKPASAEEPTIPSNMELVTVTVTLPPASEKLATEALSGHGDSCPQSRVSSLLGVEITSPHGVVIGKVRPEGLAAKAGIKTGDSIVMANGSEVTCPQTFEPFLKRGDKPTDVKLTIARKKAAAGAATEKPTADKPK